MVDLGVEGVIFTNTVHENRHTKSRTNGLQYMYHIISCTSYLSLQITKTTHILVNASFKACRIFKYICILIVSICRLKFNGFLHTYVFMNYTYISG